MLLWPSILALTPEASFVNNDFCFSDNYYYMNVKSGEVGRATRGRDPGFLDVLEATISALKFLLSCERGINLYSLSLYYLEIAVTCSQTLHDTESNILTPGNSKENSPSIQVKCIIFSISTAITQNHDTFKFFLFGSWLYYTVVCLFLSPFLILFFKREETYLLFPVIHNIIF